MRNINDIMEAVSTGQPITAEERMDMVSLALTQRITDFADEMKLSPDRLFEAILDSMKGLASAMIDNEMTHLPRVKNKELTREFVTNVANDFNNAIVQQVVDDKETEEAEKGE